MVATRYLKCFAVLHQLPVLERKWAKVNGDLLSRGEKAVQNKLLVRRLASDGLSYTEICRSTGLSRATVWKYPKVAA
jgi:DNA invertase Pin-like site-specific DNA recombinase